jgi:tRNA pseudouridine32 synthase/23S rRNA pseudouridine746 synthase
VSGPPDAAPPAAPGPAVLFADEHVLAVDKPAGRIVIPGRGAPERTVLDEARAAHGRLWVVHRLDRGTSGVLLFARSAAAHRALNLAFDGRAVAKRYLALVRGAPPDAQRLDAWIAPARRGRMRPVAAGDPRGKPSATEVRVVERFPAAGLALVECAPETGRTHQIRVHLAAAGTPLALDADYGDGTPVAGLARTPLHAASLELAHPVTGATLRVEAPLPPDLAAAVAWARAAS